VGRSKQMSDYYCRSEEIATDVLFQSSKEDRIFIAKGDFLNRIKDWMKEKWTGFRTVEVDKESSAIDYIKYNKRNKILEIKYKQRGTYQYAPVPEKVVEKMLEARSKGKFLNKFIKNKFRYRKVAFVLVNETAKL
jgi:hypothetical protein